MWFLAQAFCESLLHSHARMSEKKNTTEFIELPLEDLRQMFTSDAQKKFLQEQVVEKQKGTAHPQDGSAWWMVDVVACAHENLLYVLE